MVGGSGSSSAASAAEPGSRRRAEPASPIDGSSPTFPGPSIIRWALDGRFDLVDVEAQRTVVQQLQNVGVDSRALVMDLSKDENAAELIQQLRAARQGARWRLIECRFSKRRDPFLKNFSKPFPPLD